MLLLTKQLVGREFAIKAPNNYFTSGQRDAQQADSHLAQVDGKRFWYSEKLPKEGTQAIIESDQLSHAHYRSVSETAPCPAISGLGARLRIVHCSTL